MTVAGMALALPRGRPYRGSSVSHSSARAGAAIVPALFRVAAAAPGVSSSAACSGCDGRLLRRRRERPAIGFLARGVGLTASALAHRRRRCVIALLGPRLQRVGSVVVAKEIEKVGVVGLGAMGAGIAQLCVEAGVETVGREVSLELGEGARDRIGHFLTRRWRKGSSTRTRATRPSAGCR